MSGQKIPSLNPLHAWEYLIPLMCFNLCNPNYQCYGLEKLLVQYIIIDIQYTVVADDAYDLMTF